MPRCLRTQGIAATALGLGLAVLVAWSLRPTSVCDEPSPRAAPPGASVTSGSVNIQSPGAITPNADSATESTSPRRRPLYAPSTKTSEGPIACAAPHQSDPDAVARTGVETRGPSSPRLKSTVATVLYRPQDVDRLLRGIRETYELDRLDNPEAELALLRAAAERGTPEALLDLGLFLAYGEPGTTDPALAADTFRRAIEVGSARALAELGRLHLSGQGVRLDPELAAMYFQQAWEAGEPEGAFLLGMAHRLDLFEGADPAGALEYLSAAADRGHTAAQTTAFTLQNEHAMDFGGESKVLLWLEAAAATGDTYALTQLARYLKKQGRIDDARTVLETAAEAGSFYALEMLMASNNPLRSGRWRDLIAAHTSNPETAPAEAYLWLAVIDAVKPGSPEGDALIHANLQEASARHNSRASVACRLIEQGAPVRSAVGQMMAMKQKDVYPRLVELQAANHPEVEYRQIPIPIHSPEPPYPAELNASKQRGRVVVSFLVDRNGIPVEIAVVEASHPAFAASAIETLSTWRFKPGMAQGQTIPVKMKQPFAFTPAR